MFNSNLTRINYIGSIHHDNILPKFQQFAQSCRVCGKDVKVFSNVGFDENRQFIKDTYISVDIRGDWHQQCGYIPCRIWKNLSYGKFIGINSPHTGKILDEFVAYNNNPQTLYFTTESQYANLTKQKMKQTMLYIKENHTYINRIENLLKILED